MTNKLDNLDWTRCTDADREKVIDWLDWAYINSVLDVIEYQQRISEAIEAKHKYQLTQTTEQLPVKPTVYPGETVDLQKLAEEILELEDVVISILRDWLQAVSDFLRAEWEIIQSALTEADRINNQRHGLDAQKSPFGPIRKWTRAA